MYPLCITTIEKELVSGSSLIQGDIVQIDKSVQRYDSDTDDTLALDFVNSGQAIGVFELDKDLIISKTNQREVIARQIYKDKATLNEVMEHCAISQRFQFRVDRSNSVRPIVVMDGSHLKSYYTGTFVSANTLDGAAYGVIDSESDAIWTWFFEQFKIAYGGRENMCIVSDRNESIIKYVSRVYPDVPHFACIWHLWNNIYKKFKKSHAKLSEIYFSMAKAYTQAEFDSLMEKVETVDIRVKEYLELAGYEHWARFYAHVNRGWTMTSNIVESISATLLSARELSIYDFLEEVRKMFGRWNCTNRKEATQTYTTLEKKYQEMLTLNEAMSTLMTLHTVTDRGRNYTVCLLERKCVCGRFQVDELPCPHAWAVLKSKFLMPEDYCSNYYKPNSVVMTYDVLVYSLPDRNEWNIPAHVAEEVVLPPKWKRPPGRPKKKRDKPFSELLQPKN
uniref:Uncharacterized protein LOC104236416 n=1 Tax=Nicotiana sylvestris TaxID=4096 RepID=A0A1U7X948_NICSY|nr:PREDICTED: uncharacterized protein LOC104236416 [Nicotiana sylvestris]